MAFLVQKFGGTSVGSIERINAVAERIAHHLRAGHRIVAVVSAMSGETNRLEKLGFDIARRPPPREMDMLLAAGEQVSIALLAMALIERGFPARSYLGSQVRIRTDANHMRARIEQIDVNELIGNADAGITPVIAGFQGVTRDGQVTTFGRGASDTTAVAVAAALKADECQIYTDVDGVFTADPNIVQSAQRLDAITVEEMLELASLGSKVLHSRSLEFVGKYGVPLRVLSSFQPLAAVNPGTLITREAHAREHPLVSGVTYVRDEAKLTVHGAPDQPGIASQLLSPISAAGIEVDMIVQNASADDRADLTFTVRRADYERARELLDAAAKAVGARSTTGSDQIAKVSVVGAGMRAHPGVAARMFHALAADGINIQMVSTSEIKVSVVVDERYFELAVRTIHETFGLDATHAGGADIASVPARRADAAPFAKAGDAAQDAPAGLAAMDARTLEQPLLSGVTFARDEAKLTALGVPDAAGMASQLLSPIGDAGINVDMIVQNDAAADRTDLTFTVRRADYERARELLDVARHAVGIRGIEGDERIAKVSVLGVGMRSHAGVATRMFEALATERVNIEMISTSESKISVVVGERRLESAVCAIRRAFELTGDQVRQED